MSRYTKYRYSKHQSDCGVDDGRKASKKIMGVCAGLANQFGWDIYTLRGIALLGLFFVTLPTLVIYIVLRALFF
ncbi:MAG: PspC domain-containing protein [Enterobacterales bacterium]|nr:PspC domain-containing protein [Enterobacterales bacterium]